jgi:hypothetical protein
MEDSYIRIKSIFDREVKQKGFMTMPNTISFSVKTSQFNEFVQILGADNIKPRQKDELPRRATLSIPTSKECTLVLGLRYQKKDDTYTEDAYIIEPEKKIWYLNKGKIEKYMPEYKGTHKRQSDY